MINKVLQRFSSMVQLYSKDRLATVLLNNPSKRNALSKQMVSELNEVIQDLNTNHSIDCVVLRSAQPGMFCAGADLKERNGLSNEQTEDLVQGLRNTFQRFHNLPQPTIALLSGATLGGGLELALACDIRVAVKDAIIGLPETTLAIIPGAGGTQRLHRIIGKALAKELIFTGRRLQPQEALSIGLINYLTDDYQTAEQKCHEIAQLILQNGPIAVRCAKKAINLESSLEDGLAVEGHLYHHVTASEDRLEGLKAFAEKRKPKYFGK